MNPSDTPTTSTPTSVDRARLAFERTRAERDALPVSALRRPNVDIQSAIVIGLGCLKLLAPFRAQIIEELSKFPISVFDNLEDYVHATEHALAITSVPARIADAFPEESRQLSEKRRTLLGDIEVLQRRGYIAEDATTNARGGKGLRNVAFDVRLFSEILLSALPACEGKTAVSVEELTSAKELASTVLRAIGERDLAVLSSPASLELRMRAFTLFANAYDKIRRAMTYLRWDEGDADTFAPTIFAHRGPARSKGAEGGAGDVQQAREAASSPEGGSSADSEHAKDGPVPAVPTVAHGVAGAPADVRG